MRYQLVTGPAEDLVSRADAKEHLRIDGTDEDNRVDQLIAAASAYLEGRVGILGRPLVSQTWRLDVRRPAGNRIVLDMADVQSITSVKYLSSDVLETWSSSEYRLEAIDAWRSIVEPADGYAFPSADDRSNAFQVTFVAGYGDATDVPPPIHQAALLLIGHWYENREAVNIGNITSELPLGVKALLAPYQLTRIG